MKRLTFLLALLLGLAAVANGTQGGNEFSIDGAPNLSNARGVGFSPPSDAIAEFKVQTNAFDAQSGHTAGAVVNLALKSGKNAALMSEEFKVVKVDVGRFDRNLDIANAYGNPIKKGIPAAAIVASDNRVLYATRAGELADARSMNADGIYGFFRDAMAKAKASH